MKNRFIALADLIRLYSSRIKASSIALAVFSILITTLSCKKDDEILIINPDAGPSFIDIANDGYFVQLNAVPVREGQIGTWRTYIGENGLFDDIHDPRTKFHGEPGETYQLGWEVVQGDEYRASTITVSFKALEPIIFTAIADTVINNVSLEIEALPAMFGASGKWEIISGNDGRLVAEDNYVAHFIGKKYTNYKVSWSLTYGSKEVSTFLEFTTGELQAQAGQDQLDIKTSKVDSIKFYTLNAVLPPGAKGVWNILDNQPGLVIDPTNPNSLIQGVADSLYHLTWNVELDDYTSIDTVTIRFRGKWGMWQDERDDQFYRFTEIDGLEWMADSYNYATNPGVESWYYGSAYRSIIADGYSLESEEERKKYGRLYSFGAARDLAPFGWRLPTAEEVEAMVNSLGGDLYAKDKLITGGETGLDLNYPGFLEFSSSSDPAFRNAFRGQDSAGYFWTQTYGESTGYGIVLAIETSSERVLSGVLNFGFYAFPVRYVREVQSN